MSQEVSPTNNNYELRSFLLIIGDDPLTLYSVRSPRVKRKYGGRTATCLDVRSFVRGKVIMEYRDTDTTVYIRMLCGADKRACLGVLVSIG